MPANKRSPPGFSLTELLVALAVSAIVAPAIVMLIPRSFKALESARATASCATQALEFDCAFDRDFSSIVPECGFEGGPSRCAFWTLAPRPDGTFAPALVSYNLDGAAVSRAETSLLDFAEAFGTNTLSIGALFAADAQSAPRQTARTFGVAARSMRYGSGDEMSPEWSCPTNAPCSAEISFAPRRRLPARRLFLRWRQP